MATHSKGTRSLVGPVAWLIIASSAALSGCTPRFGPPPIVSEASQLGSVIIYRNGVAYFERYADAEEKELAMRVPSERVDDFLKSLSIVDMATKEPIPVSYPTLTSKGGYVDMTIDLPPKHGRLRITYVTESPAWKPTYRVVLGAGDTAKLQGWAVVDNVSGEDWKNVRVGVGSTSALSFRYDLHSVRVVERETLGGGDALAAAPPTGGSSYSAGGKKVRVVGNISQSQLAVIEKEERGRYADKQAEQSKPVAANRAATGQPHTKAPSHRYGASSGGGYGGYATGASGAAVSKSSGYGQGKSYAYAPRPKPVPTTTVSVPRHQSQTWQISRELKNTAERVRVEGFAQDGDKDPRQASLDRANTMRDKLIAEGVPADRIEAVGTGKRNTGEAVRVVALREDQKPRTTPAGAAQEGQPLGQAHFVSDEAMTIESDHSAMVSILNTSAKVERVFYYDPISARGSKHFAFNAVRLENPSKYTLDGGPFTVYADGQFLGEGLTDAVLPGQKAFVPYALDRSILVEPTVEGREEIDKLVTIQRGIVTTETKRIRRTKLTVTNRGKQDAKVYLRHRVAQGYELTSGTKSKLAIERLNGAHLFHVTVKAGEAVKLLIDEETPIEKTVDIRSDSGVREIGLSLRQAKLEAPLKEQLADIIKRHTARANLEERIHLLREQMAVYRTRVDELNVQLVTLKKVTQAQKLRAHLAKKMEEISERLQSATIEMANLEGQLMTMRIELQDKLSELTLKKEQDKPEKVAEKE